MADNFRASLSILGRAPSPGMMDAPTAQVWRGGATDLATRTMIGLPPLWLRLNEYPGGIVPAQADGAILHWDLEQILPGRAMPPDDAGGVILVSMDVDAAQEEEFNDWYNTEHIPHFANVPGVMCARRFRAIANTGAPRYVALYHVGSTDVYATRAWMAANETPWILRMRRFQRNRTYFMFRTRER